MKKEEAEKIVRGIQDKIECNTADIDDWAEFWGFTREEYEEFLDLAMKAVEQEAVLDKIRAEINKLTVYYTTKDKGINLISQNAVNRIIDKYKAEPQESEEE